MAEYDDIDVLIAEDSVPEAEMAIRAFEKNNLAGKLHWVKDGAEALDFLYGRGKYAARDPLRKPKFFLLDLNMPKLDGFDVLRTLKCDEAMRDIPVVIMSSSSRERDLLEGYRLGANSYIVKPVNFGEFTETVVQLGTYWLFTNRSCAQ